MRALGRLDGRSITDPMTEKQTGGCWLDGGFDGWGGDAGGGEMNGRCISDGGWEEEEA